MINVRIEEDELLDMLIERLKVWTDDSDIIALYEIYYRNMMDGGCFDGMDLNINEIVDNDWINWLLVMDKDELDAEQRLGLDDVEAEYNGFYLVRAA